MPYIVFYSLPAQQPAVYTWLAHHHPGPAIHKIIIELFDEWHEHIITHTITSSVNN